MNSELARPEAFWAEQLAKSDEDTASGDVVTSAVVHERLDQALRELQAELAGQDGSATADIPAV